MALKNRIQQSLGINIYYMPLYDLYHTVLYVGVSKNEGKSMVKQPAMKMGVSVGNGFTIFHPGEWGTVIHDELSRNWNLKNGI